ncbi:hypothetical protein GCM10023219_24290 [Stakelama sediminis]|uniref:Flp pilus assembly protein TadD n=1 Tax=Stakelama sediminis TaxID=463200 RepID=A0A840YZ22_9SPHN|nr:tetratricopeptide repeat protein [Stakelama sediminis]MBB5718893.1 Flp pilus assembly protein TadD [Stakelama sediminis]
MLIVGILALLAATPGVAGQNQIVAGEKAQDPDSKAVDAAITAIRASQPDKAITLVEPVIAHLDKDIAAEKRLVFCGPNMTEALVYATLGQSMKPKRDTLVLNDSGCMALWIKGFALNGQGKFAEAVAPLKRATELAPMHSQFFSELGFAYQQLKQPELSLAAYKSAETYAGFSEDEKFQRARALRGEGFAYVDLGKWDEAEKAYQDSLKDDPDSKVAKNELEFIKQNRPKD